MAYTLSSASLSTFCGDVQPLWLLGDGDNASIRWAVEGDAVCIRIFDDAPNGILLTPLHPGEAVITATYGDTQLRCSVSVRAMQEATSEEATEYFLGDFHDHTTMIHNAADFKIREDTFPIDLIEQYKADGRIDFHVISDHGDVVDNANFLQGFIDAETAKPSEVIVFPGCESEVTLIETDRYGFSHKNSGELVTVNADNYAGVRTWEEFFERFGSSPYAIFTLAHPQIIGWDANGVWNFCLDTNNSARFRERIRQIEIGDGTDRYSNLINEYVYSKALDNGFRVSTTCSSDNHGPIWNSDTFPGKTVIMAPVKSKEAFLDALLHNRVYATESGNVKLRYTVNGHVAPADIPRTNRYDFHISLAYFHEDATTAPIRCQVISDRGETVASVDCTGKNTFDIALTSDTARYFFLRLTDCEGRKTWSPAVWTGRPFSTVDISALAPLDKDGFTAINTRTGKDVAQVINDAPDDVVTFEEGKADIVIDMQKIQSVSAVGHYPPRLIRSAMKDTNDERAHIAMLASEYEIATSLDGVTYTRQAAGTFRTFGGEEIISFPACETRYVRVSIHSTVGMASGRPMFRQTSLMIGELSVFA